MTIPALYVDFYNLKSNTVCGVAQVKEIRQVTPRKGKPFIACTLIALLGPSEQPRHRYYDCVVTGKVAEQEILECKEACEAGQKILIGFNLSTADLKRFTYRNGERKGEVGFTERADLVAIDWLTIDDELKYQLESDAGTDDDADAQSTPASGSGESEPAEPIAAAS